MSIASNDLFSINKITHEDGAVSAVLGINAESEILKGHFPGQPIVPGACMLQVLKDVLESALGYTLRLSKAGHLKFMIMIDPANTPTVQLNIYYKKIEDGDISITAKLSNADVVYFKFQGSFVSK